MPRPATGYPVLARSQLHDLATNNGSRAESDIRTREEDHAKMHSTVTIARPLEEVYRFFLDLERNAPRTDPSVEYVVKTPEGPTAPGTTFRQRQHSLAKTRETTTRFTAIEPNRKIEFEATIGPIDPSAPSPSSRQATERRSRSAATPTPSECSSRCARCSTERDNRSGRADSNGSRACWRHRPPGPRRCRERRDDRRSGSQPRSRPRLSARPRRQLFRLFRRWLRRR